jgi:cytochrome b
MEKTGIAAKDDLGTKIETLWDFEIRASAVCLFLLLVMAYVTGEEYQHTHPAIGYSIAALMIAQLSWELSRPHSTRYLDSILHPPSVRPLFQPNMAHPKISSGFFVLAVATTIAVIALAALVLVFFTHNFYPATAVDEMHEVVTYLAVGLVIFHVVLVIVASLQSLDHP